MLQLYVATRKGIWIATASPPSPQVQTVVFTVAQPVVTERLPLVVQKPLPPGARKVGLIKPATIADDALILPLAHNGSEGAEFGLYWDGQATPVVGGWRVELPGGSTGLGGAALAPPVTVGTRPIGDAERAAVPADGLGITGDDEVHPVVLYEVLAIRGEDADGADVVLADDAEAQVTVTLAPGSPLLADDVEVRAYVYSNSRTYWVYVGRAEVDAREHRCAGHEHLRAGPHAGRDDATDEDSIVGDAIEGRRGAEIDGDRVDTEEVHRREGVDDAVGADAERLLHVESDGQRRACVDDRRLEAEVPLAHLGQTRGDWRDDGADRAGADGVHIES